MHGKVKAMAVLLALACLLTLVCGCSKPPVDNPSGGTTTNGDDVATTTTTAADSIGGADSGGEGDILRPNPDVGDNTGTSGNNKATTTKTTKNGGGASTTTGTSGSSGTDSGFVVSPAVNSDSYKIDTEQEKRFSSLSGKTVTVISGSSIGTNDEQQAADILKKKYNLNVKYIAMGWNEMQEKITALVAGGDPPDLAPFSEVLSLRYAYGNLAKPIDSYVVKNDPVWTKNNAFERFTYDGKIYGASDYGYDVFLVYYNKTLFEENNVKQPIEYYNEGKWNFETFRQVAKQMTLYESDGVTPKTFGVATWYYPVFIMANGGKGIAYSNGKWSVTMDQKAEIEGMQLIHDLVADGSLLAGSDGYVDFRQRKIAMTIERPMNAVGSYDYYNRMDDEIGMVPVPKGPSVSQYYAPVISDAYFVTATAENPLGAVAFIYELRAFKIKKEVSTDSAVLAERRKVISDEHLKLYNDYLSKAVIAYNLSEGMSGWWDGPLNRNQVWNKIVVDQSQPSQVIDSIKGLMLDSLRRTVGASNVRN